MMCLYIEGPPSMVLTVKVGNQEKKMKVSKTNNSEKDRK